MNTAAVSTTAPSRDVVRQVGVISATVFMIIAAMVGSGVFGGTPVQDLQNGALDADGSWLAPGRSAFSIWSVIYLLMIAYTVYQALPGQREDERQRRLGWWIALTAVLNGLWLVTAQYGTLPLTVLVIALLLAALAVTFRRAIAFPPRNAISALLVDGTVGLHFGWVTVATVVNIAAWLTAVGDPSWASAADFWASAVLVVVAAIGFAITWRSGWRLAPALAMSWGLLWIAIQRWTGEPNAPVVGGFAIVASAVILLPAVVGRVRRLARPR